MSLLIKKRGLSIMIGYVLLITCAMIMGVVVYQWIKTYVPADALECPEGVSILIKEYEYICEEDKLSLTLKNNGLFNIAGYFIHATTSEDQELAIEDLSSYTTAGKGKGGSVWFSTGNSFGPNDEPKTNVFKLGDSEFEKFYSIEIIPFRWQEEEGKERFVSCGGAKVKDELSCACVAETTEETCEDWECGTKKNNCDEDVICPPNDCGEGFDCSDGACVEGTVCGNGIIKSPKKCDDGDTDNGDGCSSSCAVETGWDCNGEPSICVPEGIISWWKLNDASIEDSIGENDGTCTQCPEFITDSERGEVASFDGNNDYITASVGTLNSPFSISAWGYFNSLDQGNNDYDYISMIGTGADMVSISRHAAGDDVNKYYTYTESGVLLGPVLSGQEWLHIVVVWDDTSPYHSLYINGVSQTVEQPTAAIDTNGEIVLGEYITHSHQINGKIDDVMIFNKALSEDEIDALYNL